MAKRHSDSDWVRLSALVLDLTGFIVCMHVLCINQQTKSDKEPKDTMEAILFEDL